jgi:large subunit ribosomal protein L6
MIQTKKIELALNEKKALSYGCINQQKFFIYSLKSSFNPYFLFANQLKIKLNKRYLYFNNFILNDPIFFDNFNNEFLKFIKNSGKEYSKKLVLTGLGFRVNYIQESNILKFKLGFSHLVDIKIPSNSVYTVIKKNTIHITGTSLSYIGNFCQKIQNLKKINAYNGKGFSFKNENIICKVYKKNK